MIDIRSSITRLENLCKIVPPLLRKIGDDEFSAKPAPGKWSKKEILGHLIDSAANNHHRLVRGQFGNLATIVYDPDLWNAHNYHQLMPRDHIIAFWQIYNVHIINIMKNLPAELLDRKVGTGEGGEKDIVTLSFVFEDYVVHMEHHLRQIVSY